ncbi:MAG: ribosome biogenesis GTPase Der, partial [Terriglobia bacterium]
MPKLYRDNSTLPLVAIVGRPNVGKSALFNRLTGQRRAIVTNEPGITRDRLYGRATWQGKEFEVVDTGGLMPDEKAQLAQDILRQARTAIDAARQLVLVVDARAGPTPLDADLARLLRRTGKPVVLAVNKVDTPSSEATSLAFHEFGISPVIPVSAEHSLGVDTLLDELTREFPAAETAPVRTVLNVAIIGRPNGGKSTLVNRLVGEERVIVSAEPGTTRDPIDTLLRHNGRWWRLIDTAGIRRKGKTKLRAEKLSVVMARKHLERADVAVLLIDATAGMTKLDAAIAGYAHASGRSVILAVNKWDAVEKKTGTSEQFTAAVRRRMKFFDYAPLVFISALTGQRVDKLLRLVEEIGVARGARIPAERLRAFVRTLRAERATVPGGRPLRIQSLRQVAAGPPRFEVTTNLPKLHFGVERFLENQLRAHFPFPGTPIRFRLRPLGVRRRTRARWPEGASVEALA